MHKLAEQENVNHQDYALSGKIVQCLPVLFFLADSQMQLFCWNRMLEDVSAYAPHELACMDLQDLFNEGDRSWIIESIKDLPASGKITMEADLLDKNGNKSRHHLTFSRISIDDDRACLIVIGIDRADQYKNEELLRNLSRAVEQSASSIVITDTEGTIEYVNPSFLQMTGYGLEEIVGSNPLTSKSDLSLPNIFCDSWETIVSGGEWRSEQLNKKKNGEMFWESVSISPIRNAENITTHYLAVREDITARKKTERELLKSKAELLVQHEQLQNLFHQVERTKKEWESSMDCIDDVVILADKENRIRRCNKALQEFCGITCQKLIGKEWHELLISQGLDVPVSCKPGTEIYHTPSGRWFLFNSYPFTDSALNEVTGSVITLHETTVVKKFTNELEKAYADLKATQAKVVQQEKMASIGQLAAGVAHEINNPMGFISSNLSTLRKYLERLEDFINAQSELIEKVPDKDAAAELQNKRKALKLDYILEDGRDLIKESLEGTERVRTIVQNLKSFSRVDEAECKHADINECINSTINIVWNELKYKAALIKELGDIPPIRCHPQQINQVFMNLLVNAAQAIEHKGEITVKTWHENESVYAQVADTGCGMPESVVNRIFEPFYTTKEVGKGTGLGLSITYDIIKMHGGEISVASEPGRGSSFTVRLPAGQ